MTKRRHVLVLAGLVARRVAAQPRHEARLLASRLRCSVEQGEVQLARELGAVELVERACNEHLASLGADDGLTVLSVGWEEVIGEALRLLEAAPSHCNRCGARLGRRRTACSRCRERTPGRF